MKIVARLLIIPLLLLLTCCGGSRRSEESITIATAANMQFAMEALTEAFTARTGITCILVVGSSGKLTAQIVEGAPYDIFVAANMKYPRAVAAQGKAAGEPRLYALGSLVLWTVKEDLQPFLEVLASDSVTHIAVANPATAPYGQAAIEVLEHYGLRESLDTKLVFGESIAQTNQFIISGAAEIGFTALSVVRAPEMRGKGQWIAIPSQLHSPIEQGVVLLRNEEKPDLNATLFYDYLLSEEAGEILENFGYSRDE